MEQHVINLIIEKLPYKKDQITSVLKLLEEKNTVPFIARYRKEVTGELDEVEIKEIETEYRYMENLQKRKVDVVRSIEEQGMLTDDLKKEIMEQTKLQRVEDLYRPFKQKKKTRATEAKRKGLEPLAKAMLNYEDVHKKANEFITEEVTTAEDAINGAIDIIAEMISDEPKYRSFILGYAEKNGGIVTSKKKKAEDEKGIFEMYYEYSERINKIVPHRILAINRGEKENVLKVDITVDETAIVRYLKKQMMKQESKYIERAIEESLKRLILPSIYREVRNELTEKAESQAIEIFSVNLENLLLQAPLKGKMILGLDPAYRTGCKLAVINPFGTFVEKSVVYPHPPVSDKEKAKKIVLNLIKKHNVELVAIGNGTASRESEQFIAEIIKENNLETKYIIVNEAGASVYSASDLARAEFPDFQVEERSAVSIGRRVQDPLSELVKIDPKSIGVGQYQHDVNQKSLNEALTFVVETAVNKVGVNVNTASAPLLQYVSGLSKAVAENIINYRIENGPIKHHKEIAKIPRLGKKTFEQSIGFIRIPDGEEPLDNTGIHPESYKATYALLKKLSLTAENLGSDELKESINKIDVQSTADELGIGVPTLEDIIAALMTPGRDPREDFETPLLKSDVLSIEDLRKGMKLSGTVRNVVDFGAFVDIGVKQDGLVHISKLSERFIKHPTDVVSVGDIVDVWIEDIMHDKGKVALTMINPDGK
ncbi:RNA-binding transcriptional accessory protein [Macrococcoides canis]|uniref:RNA-binding transcriptional accessory protein n=1 Tax=Macrococcoides canis TaxID=1855823 RepID=A0A4V3BFL7_9STAP|nr:Tex family protein [Macrococcus canis]TDM14768.1 RNA-binding transcriptional accessory protein [Macrococcus canis]TDM21103.1 RNA-binding transcriptional accessory protein [Macrococcus canis]TDM35324.1 RNA-binding transcriptional accessory protein [Macrococcus canis]